jgi:hypothetical protein
MHYATVAEAVSDAVGEDEAASLEIARLIRVLDEVDPLAARIARWRYVGRRFSDQLIAERLGWAVHQVVAVCDEALTAAEDTLLEAA